MINAFYEATSSLIFWGMNFILYSSSGENPLHLFFRDINKSDFFLRDFSYDR